MSPLEASGPPAPLRFQARARWSRSAGREDEMAMPEVHPVETARPISDLYLGATLLATGHHLVTTTREGGRVLFHFTGPGVGSAVLAGRSRWPATSGRP
jgi:hypothetical protein